MDEFEKVEKLRQRANVSYEEAKEALRNSNGDLLDAMIYLEKQGKVNGPAQSSYSTQYEAQPGYRSVENTENCGAPKKTFKEKMKELFVKSNENHFTVNHNGNTIIDIPVWALILIAVVAWYALIVAVVIGLFAGCRFSFKGPDTINAVNNAMEQVGNACESLAGQVKSSFEKKENETEGKEE